MPATKIRADFDQLTKISNTFSKESEDIGRTLDSLRRAKDALQGGDWIGKGADKFYAEMDGAVLPTLLRLKSALADAARATGEAARVMQEARGEASNILRSQGGDGGAGGGGSSAAGAAGAAGGSGAAGGGGAGGASGAGGGLAGGSLGSALVDAFAPLFGEDGSPAFDVPGFPLGGEGGLGGATDAASLGQLMDQLGGVFDNLDPDGGGGLGGGAAGDLGGGIGDVFDGGGAGGAGGGFPGLPGSSGDPLDDFVSAIEDWRDNVVGGQPGGEGSPSDAGAQGSSGGGSSGGGGGGEPPTQTPPTDQKGGGGGGGGQAPTTGSLGSGAAGGSSGFGSAPGGAGESGGAPAAGRGGAGGGSTFGQGAPSAAPATGEPAAAASPFVPLLMSLLGMSGGGAGLLGLGQRKKGK